MLSSVFSTINASVPCQTSVLFPIAILLLVPHTSMALFYCLPIGAIKLPRPAAAMLLILRWKSITESVIPSAIKKKVFAGGQSSSILVRVPSLLRAQRDHGIHHGGTVRRNMTGDECHHCQAHHCPREM